MSSRQISEPVAVAFGAPILNIAWIIRLDIETDPVYAWTGLGPLVVGASQFLDAEINGRTYTGLANIGEIGRIVDTMSGSQAVKLTLPGVRLDDDALHQIVFDQRKWQGRRGFLWVVPITEGGALAGEPVRAKTGRMDNLKVERRQGEGVVRIELESFAAYSQRAILTRYSEQKELDATDTSQDYVHDLANRTAGIGDKANATSGNSYGGSSGGGGGGTRGGGGGDVSFF
jgi:hypothetical protein